MESTVLLPQNQANDNEDDEHNEADGANDPLPHRGRLWRSFKWLAIIADLAFLLVRERVVTAAPTARQWGVCASRWG